MSLKTAKEWFEETLPIDIQASAINYISKGVWDEKFHSFGYALRCAFYWNNTVEGYDYWRAVHEKFKDKH